MPDLQDPQPSSGLTTGFEKSRAAIRIAFGIREVCRVDYAGQACQALQLLLGLALQPLQPHRDLLTCTLVSMVSTGVPRTRVSDISIHSFDISDNNIPRAMAGIDSISMSSSICPFASACSALSLFWIWLAWESLLRGGWSGGISLGPHGRFPFTQKLHFCCRFASQLRTSGRH